MISCSDEGSDVLNANSKSMEYYGVTIQWPKDLRLSVESDIMKAEHGCYTVQVRIYMTETDRNEKLLICSSVVKVGECAENRPVDNCTGTYKDQFITSEYVNPEFPEACAIAVFDDQPTIYNEYLTQRRALTGL
ncbi:hypothetical protein [Flavobacterium pallidum]|uniref:Uncharacterized protein n=1 Tax=Flavobacterium pallidum TaxID=2172098 RepID=A0A2S1SEB1_9FLAO|nr:hypothetical protein [Flavobacterium pallidum]AWI24692.1 hypothetical protein HYN49_01615 [Flavobacterium pallidum]